MRDNNIEGGAGRGSVSGRLSQAQDTGLISPAEYQEIQGFMARAENPQAVSLSADEWTRFKDLYEKAGFSPEEAELHRWSP